MRRLIFALTAVVLVAAPLATAGGAMAKDHHEQRAEQKGGRGQEMRGGPQQVFRGGGQDDRGGGGRFERVDPRGDPRNDPRNDPRYDPRGGYQAERIDPRYDPRYGPPPGAYQAAPRRGGYLGPGSGGPVIQDPGRYRLRAPPRGYEWVRTPGGMALVQQGTGRVYDVVPN